MPRMGHKEGCQCVVCKAMQAKELREKPQAPVMEEALLGILKPGDKFKYKANQWVPVRTYIKYGTDKGIVVAEGVAGGDIIRLSADTLVLKA